MRDAISHERLQRVGAETVPELSVFLSLICRAQLSGALAPGWEQEIDGLQARHLQPTLFSWGEKKMDFRWDTYIACCLHFLRQRR